MDESVETHQYASLTNTLDDFIETHKYPSPEGSEIGDSYKKFRDQLETHINASLQCRKDRKGETHINASIQPTIIGQKAIDFWYQIPSFNPFVKLKTEYELSLFKINFKLIETELGVIPGIVGAN